VNCLKFILFLLVQIAHFGKDLRVAGYLGDQNVVPFESFSSHSDEFVDVSNLVQNFIAIGNNGVQLFKGLQRLIVVAQAFVDQT